MPTKLTEGAAVRLSDRDAGAADVKSGLFYPHYRGLTGTLTKLYTDGTANVTVDPESLPDEIRKRHQAGTDAMRKKWLDGLSDEARNKLTGAEKKFSLRYSLLADVADLSLQSAPRPAPEAARPVQTSLEMDAASEAAEAARKNSADLDDAEARHLAEVARKRQTL